MGTGDLMAAAVLHWCWLRGGRRRAGWMDGWMHAWMIAPSGVQSPLRGFARPLTIGRARFKLAPRARLSN